MHFLTLVLGKRFVFRKTQMVVVKDSSLPQIDITLTVPIDKMLSVKNVRAWVSIVSYLKK